MVLMVSFCSVSIFFLLFIFLIFHLRIQEMDISNAFKYHTDMIQEKTKCFNETRMKKRVDIIRVKSDALFYPNML